MIISNSFESFHATDGYFLYGGQKYEFFASHDRNICSDLNFCELQVRNNIMELLLEQIVWDLVQDPHHSRGKVNLVLWGGFSSLGNGEEKRKVKNLKPHLNVSEIKELCDIEIH